MYAIHYSTSNHQPTNDGKLWKWTVDRTGTIGAIFTRIKKQTLLFPSVRDCGSFLDEICCELAVHDNAKRAIVFTHPETLPDDALHALNYAHILGVYQHSCRGQWDS